MSEAATVGVIRDLLVVAALALLFALPFYASLRRRADTSWNFAGNVLAQPYNWLDAGAVVALLLFLFFPMFLAPGKAEESAGSQALSVEALLASLVLNLMMAFAVLAYLRVLRGLNPAELFGMRQMTAVTAFLWAFGALFVTYFAMVGAKLFVEQVLYKGSFPDRSSQETVQAFEHSAGFGFRILMGVTAVIVAPVVEETLFRGFIYAVTKRLTDRWFSACFTSLIFALMHHHVGSIVPLFVLAVGFTLAYEATGCLLVPIFMHALFNGFNLVLMSLMPSQ
jgi:membrane protease YdiL (CAAX protease family)